MNQFPILEILGVVSLVVLVLFILFRKKNPINTNSVDTIARAEANLKKIENAVLLTGTSESVSTTTAPKLITVRQANPQVSNASFDPTLDTLFITSESVSSLKRTRSAPTRSSSPKELLDQKVSTLRRVFFNTNVLAHEAEEAIDLYLTKINTTNYVKSKRRPNHIYAPIVVKTRTKGN